MDMAIETGLGDVLLKVVLFLLVQALVYLILSNSSNIFSKNPVRSTSFKPARSISIRRFIAALADMPSGGEASPSAKDMASPSAKDLGSPSTKDMMLQRKKDRTAHEHAS